MKASRTPFWLEREPQVSFAALHGNFAFDLAIVGAGIVGLQTAYFLRESGLKVCVLEARKIGHQATGKSTAKVTSQHGLKYGSLIRNFGREGAKRYAEANEKAKEEIAAICSTLPDRASLEARTAFIYSQDDEQAESLKAEADAAASLDLPAEFFRPTDFPVRATGALRFSDQYQFDPYLYLCGLAQLANGSGVALFEDSRVLKVTGDGPFELKLDLGVVTATKVVVATQMPIVGDGLFFSRAFPFAHAVTAAPLPEHVTLDGMFISAGTPSRSFRTATKDSQRFLVAAGGEFKTGDQKGAGDTIADMLAFVDRSFGIKEVTHLWINEDFRSMDGVAFVGPASSSKPHLLLATGFAAWGITQGVVAAEILSAHVLGIGHPAADVFAANRMKPLAGGTTFLFENVATATHLVGERLFGSRTVGLGEIERGSGGVIEHEGEQLAVTRAPDGTLTARSAICTHLGCVVGWNEIDRTWDCSCHGSRFDEDGAVLSGPATRRLEARKLSVAGHKK